MKHLFILNPKAGADSSKTGVRTIIEEKMASRGLDHEIYVTKAPMDAAEKVRSEAEKGGELRVYACGGDGTLNECVCGAAERENGTLPSLAPGETVTIQYNGTPYTAANLYIEKAQATSGNISLKMTLYFQAANTDDYQMAINLTYTGAAVTTAQ